MNDANVTAWATLATAGLGFALAFGAFLRRSIKNSIDNLARVLDERLATKEELSALNTRVTVVETLMKIKDAESG